METKGIFTRMMLVFALALCGQTTQEAVHFMEYETGIGIKALGMGGANVAATNDYSAVYWNPAGLASLKFSEIVGDFNYQQLNNTADFSGNTVYGENTFSKLKSLGLAYKFPTTRGGLGLAIGYHRFQDLDNFLEFSGFNTFSNGMAFELENDFGEVNVYRFDRDVAQTETILEKGNLSAFSIGAGVAMSPNFHLGAAVNFIGGKSTYRFDLLQEDVNDVYTVYPANFNSYALTRQVDSEFSGVGVKVGGLIHVNEQLRVGAGVELPLSLTVDETYDEYDALDFDDGYFDDADLGRGEWKYVVKYPMKFSGGVALDFKQLLLAASCDYRDWSQVEFGRPRGYWSADYNGLLAENVWFRQDFRAVLAWGVGAEFRVQGTGLKLRGGYRVIPSALKYAEKSMDRRYFSGGLGMDLDGNTTLNISVIRGVWNQDTEDSYTPGGTHESIQADRILAGITFNLD